MRRAAIAMLLVAAGTTVSAQDVPLEYRVKAAYLYNFVRFVEWPPAAADGPVEICVVRPNPFGDVLVETLRGERLDGRPVVPRLVDAPEPGCQVVFVPAGSAAAPAIRAVQSTPTLTVGESPDFIRQGGIVNFVRDGANVRFEIDETAARRAGLRISSRLLRLARMPRP